MRALALAVGFCIKRVAVNLLIMEIKVGDRFQVCGERNSLWISDAPPIYTITGVNGEKISWDCIGRKSHYRNVGIDSIKEWLQEGRLTKIN